MHKLEKYSLLVITTMALLLNHSQAAKFRNWVSGAGNNVTARYVETDPFNYVHLISTNGNEVKIYKSHLSSECQKYVDQIEINRNALKDLMEINFVGKVGQVLDDGALVFDAHAIVPYTNKYGEIQTKLKRISPEYEPVYIYGIGQGLYDGAECGGTIYPAGTYQYESLISGKSVLCYHVDPEEAIRRILNNPDIEF